MKKILLSFCILWISIVFMACSGTSSGPYSPGDPIINALPGSLTITINDGVSKAILPNQSMVPNYYLVEGSGPYSSSFSESTYGAYTQEDVTPGDWTLIVTAFNSEGIAIGGGNASVTVSSETTASVSVTVYPYNGHGNLNLTVNWETLDINNPQIEAVLTPTSGTSIELPFTTNGSQATFSANDISTGYHSLSILLLDDGVNTAGAVEVVRIARDATTTGSLYFDGSNLATGIVQIDITTGESSPLNVSIIAEDSSKPEDEILELSVSVNDYSENVDCVWYVNGESIDTGTTFTMDKSWAQAFYRIDVTAFSVNGERAGSATQLIEVVESEAYLVGEEGPAGGIIFYDDTIGYDFDGDGQISDEEKNVMADYRYLEIEDEMEWYLDPDSGNYIADPQIEWGTSNPDGNPHVYMPVPPSVMASTIGLGYSNTHFIASYEFNVNQPGKIAADLCVEYRGGGYDDWFLGSLGEMYIMRNIIDTSIFSDGLYWTSSKIGTYSWAVGLTSIAATNIGRLTEQRVRPMRAF